MEELVVPMEVVELMLEELELQLDLMEVSDQVELMGKILLLNHLTNNNLIIFNSLVELMEEVATVTLQTMLQQEVQLATDISNNTPTFIQLIL